MCFRGGVGVNSSWAVVRSKPRQERRAAKNLQAQGYETLLPLQNVTVRRSKKLVDMSVPLFPGYLFVQMSEQCSRSILSTFGVSQLITGEGGKPKKIDPKIIDEIFKHCDETGHYISPDYFQTGDDVKLVRGAFESAVAKVQSFQSEDRLWIFLDLMGQSVKVSVSRSDVLKV
jgi:transcriptional antiterminator RfaH